MSRTIMAVTLALAALFPAVSAHAQNGQLTRSFVSSTGSNSNPCTITQPCASFAQAYTMIGANGIIAALDPGKYGPLTITGPVTVNGNGWAAITGPAQGNAITVNAVSGNVTLIGLEIDGAGAAYNGIVFNTGDSLTVTDCVVQNFVFDGSHSTTGNGIFMQPTSAQVTFAITNTVVSNNGLTGYTYFPQSGTTSGYGVIDHVVATNNFQYGFVIATEGGPVTVAVSNSIAGNNGTGILVENGASAPLTVSIDNTGASNNVYGIYAQYTPTVFLGRSVITGNTSYGVFNATSPNNTFYSYGDNRVSGNGTSSADNVPGPMVTTVLY